MEWNGFLACARALHVLSVRVTRDGECILNEDFDDDSRRNVYSASKSFTSCAVGLAVGEGLLSLEEKLVEAFADDLPAAVGENLRKATVRDLLTMCLGQQNGALMGPQRPYYPEDDWVRLSLSLPFAYAPGTRFVYNNVGPYLAGMLVQRRSGQNLVDYLLPRLFTPLGIKRPTWETDPLGHTFGAGGLFLTAGELHKFGLLYLQDGVWNGQRLIPAEWVRESTMKQVDNGGDPYGYGYLFWRGDRDSFRADGKYAQFSIVLRDKNAVVTTLSECREAGALLELIFAEVYPRL